MNEMKLTLRRKFFGDKAIIGELFIDDEIRHQCYTLEDIERDVKIDGATCIPVGKYQVIIDFSQRFGRLMPHVLDVPGFEGIRIHSGNTSDDTEGCILVGRVPVNADFIGESRLAFSELYPLLEEANRRGKIYINIIDDFTSEPVS